MKPMQYENDVVVKENSLEDQKEETHIIIKQ